MPKRPTFFTLVPIKVEIGVGGIVGSLTTPHCDEAQAALERFQHFKDELDLQLTSIVQSAGVLKSDEVVDDGACDAIVTCTQKIIKFWNEYMQASGIDATLMPPADLEPSPYQQ